jgi:hypothetical protein
VRNEAIDSPFKCVSCSISEDSMCKEKNMDYYDINSKKSQPLCHYTLCSKQQPTTFKDTNCIFNFFPYTSFTGK